MSARRAERSDHYAGDLDLMTEAELLAGLTEALTIAGWLWYHVIRSDHVSAGTGAIGFPDLVAVHPTRDQLIMWELKGAGGSVTPPQWAWIGPLAVISTVLRPWVDMGSPGTASFDARVVWPADYDRALEYIVGKIDRMPANT